MKKLIIISIMLISSNLIAQDTITKRDGTRIRAKNIKVSTNAITYKEYDDPYGYEHLVSKKELKKINYENGNLKWYGIARFIDCKLDNDRPFGWNINIGGPSLYLSFSLDYFITPHVNIEAGLGYIGFYGGIKYRLFRLRDVKNWTPYVGLYGTAIESSDPWEDLELAAMWYIPGGIQYRAPKGFTFGAEVAIAGYFHSQLTYSSYTWGAIKLGYHF